MSTFLVQSGKCSLRIPAPTERLARLRGARRYLSLVDPFLGRRLGTERFHARAEALAPKLKVRELGGR